MDLVTLNVTKISLVLYQYSQWMRLLRIPDYMIAIF